MSRSGEDSDVESDIGLEWLLGFVDPPRHKSDLLRHRFPSKVGGRPAWLDPVHLPPRDCLTCPATGRPMQFLIQVYAPVDENPNAFHRTLYIFLSPDGSTLTSPGAVKALRCQLPRKNSFYPFDPPKEGEKLPPALPADLLEVSLERDPWRSEEFAAGDAEKPTSASGGGNKGALSGPKPPALFTENELVVEPEPEESAEDDAKAKALLEQYQKRNLDEGEYTEEELPRDVVDTLEANVSEAQAHFAAFAAQIAKEPEQVLRYCFEQGATPLCPGPSGIPKAEEVPCCERCGGPRRFEFQIMPQLLNHLGVDASDPKAPDWGTIAVYSCAGSCGGGEGDGAGIGGSSYSEEYVWVQKPV